MWRCMKNKLSYWSKWKKWEILPKCHDKNLFTKTYLKFKWNKVQLLQIWVILKMLMDLKNVMISAKFQQICEKEVVDFSLLNV